MNDERKMAIKVKSGHLRVSKATTINDKKPVLVIMESSEYRKPGTMYKGNGLNKENIQTLFAMVIEDKTQAEAMIKVLNHILDTMG